MNTQHRAHRIRLSTTSRFGGNTLDRREQSTQALPSREEAFATGWFAPTGVSETRKAHPARTARPSYVMYVRVFQHILRIFSEIPKNPKMQQKAPHTAEI
jgi:hypothetical protein